MTNARTALLCLLFLIGAGPTAVTNAQDERNDETAHLESEARAVADWVIACQRAGWEDLDVETYLSQFAEDATVVLGRMEEPGPYDVVYDYDTIVATRTMRMRGENPGVMLRYVSIGVVIDGDDALMRTRTITTSRGSDYREITRERFILRRDEGGWRVVENRAWLVGEVIDGERHVVDAGVWEERDVWIEKPLEGGRDARWQRDYLLHAFRFEEAHAAAIEVCGRDDAEAFDWSRRGLYAVLAGDAADAALAFARALEMDPEVWLPYYAVPEERGVEGEE